MCSSLFKRFSYPFLLSLPGPIQSKALYRFLPQIFQGFCPQALERPLYPFLFKLFTCFMHFSLKFRTKEN